MDDSMVLLLAGSALIGYSLGLTLGSCAGILAALAVQDLIAWFAVSVFAVGTAALGWLLGFVLKLPPGLVFRWTPVVCGAVLLLVFAVTVEPVEGFL